MDKLLHAERVLKKIKNVNFETQITLLINGPINAASCILAQTKKRIRCLNRECSGHLWRLLVYMPKNKENLEVGMPLYMCDHCGNWQWGTWGNLWAWGVHISKIKECVMNEIFNKFREEICIKQKK